MEITFKSNSTAGALAVPDELVGFFLWLAEHRQDERAKSLLILLAEHDLEADIDEQKNIRRTIDEILGNK